MKRHVLLSVVTLACLDSMSSVAVGTIIWDQSFNPGAVPLLQRILGTPDGRCLVAQFVEEQSVARIVRLNPDGSSDASFAPAVLRHMDSTEFVLWESVTDLALDAQGRVLVAGNFQAVNNVERRALARLNRDGTLDETFRAPTNVWSYYGSHRLASLPDGGVLFLNLYYGNEPRLVRLNTDGSLDNTFHAAGETAHAQHLLVSRTGRTIASAEYGTDRLQPLVRLEPDGGLDATFHRAEFTASNHPRVEINSVTPQSDDKIVVGGQFEFVDGHPRSSIVRLNVDGTVDATFAPSRGPEWDDQPGWLSVAAGDSRGRVLLAGRFNRLNEQTTPHDPFTGQPESWSLARLNSDGSIDPGFGPFGASALRQLAPRILSPSEIFTGGTLTQITPQADGNFLVAGYLTYEEPCFRFCSQQLLSRSFLARMYGEFPTNSFAFAAVRFTASETDAFASVTVRRLGDVSGSAAVDYATSDGSALAGQDYQPTAGTLAFGPQEAVKSFTIPLLKNGLRDRDRELALTLSNATGVHTISAPTGRVAIVKPFGLHSLRWQDGSPRLTIHGSPGSRYVLEYNPTLDPSPFWRAAAAVTLTNAEQAVSDSSPHTGERQLLTRFYRLRRVAQ